MIVTDVEGTIVNGDIERTMRALGHISSVSRLFGGIYSLFAGGNKVSVVLKRDDAGDISVKAHLLQDGGQSTAKTCLGVAEDYLGLALAEAVKGNLGASPDDISAHYRNLSILLQHIEGLQPGLNTNTDATASQTPYDAFTENLRERGCC